MDPFDSSHDDPLLPYRTSGKAKAAIITLSILLLGALGAGGYFFSTTEDAKNEIGDLNQRISVIEAEKVDIRKEAESEVSTMIATHQAEIARINSEWQGQVEAQKVAGEQQMKRSLTAISQIVNQSGETLQTMERLKNKVKEGKELQQAEIDQLKAVANGLAYLHQQYEKPIHEFKELESYLAKQLENEAIAAPQEVRTTLLTRVFNRKELKEQQEALERQTAAFHQDQGKRQAFVSAKTQVSNAYGRAQKEMSSLKLSNDQYLNNLNLIVENKTENAKNLDSFFDISTEILKIHQRVMDVKVETPEEPNQVDIQP